MIVFKSYNDTYHEYQIERINLERLEEKKEKIRSKYFKITSSPKDMEKDSTCYISSENYDDNYQLYMIELENDNIIEDIEKQRNVVNRLKYYLKCMEYHLSKLKGIEYQIFYEVIYNNKNITQAIETVAEINEKDNQTIWKNYYPNVKEHLNTFLDEKNINEIFKKNIKSTVKVQ